MNWLIKIKTQKFKIAKGDNSKLKTQNSKLRSAQQFKIQNSKLKIALRAIIQNSKLKTQKSKI